MIKKQFLIFLMLCSIGVLFCQTHELYLDKNIKLFCEIEKFNPIDHKIDTCDSGFGWKGICLIDGEPIFGTDLEMPSNQSINMSVIINDSIISLNTKYMYNVEFEGKFDKNQFKFIKCGMGYCLYGLFSDGAGTYGVCWQIINNKSFRTVITSDEWFFEMFGYLE